MSVVLDASAFLALLQDEPGGERVARELPGAVMSVANLAEVAVRQVDLGLRGDRLVGRAEALGITARDVTADDVATQAMLHARDPGRFGLSLGDRLCLALGVRLDLPVLTADRVWVEFDLPVEVILVR